MNDEDTMELCFETGFEKEATALEVYHTAWELGTGGHFAFDIPQGQRIRVRLATFFMYVCTLLRAVIAE